MKTILKKRSVKHRWKPVIAPPKLQLWLVINKVKLQKLGRGCHWHILGNHFWFLTMHAYRRWVASPQRQALSSLHTVLNFCGWANPPLSRYEQSILENLALYERFTCVFLELCDFHVLVHRDLYAATIIHVGTAPHFILLCWVWNMTTHLYTRMEGRRHPVFSADHPSKY